jgi:pseudouridine synthase
MELNQTMRLNKYLAHCGLGARRKCESIILANRVQINDQVVQDLATQVNLAQDVVMVDEKTVHPYERTMYVLLNKPKGFLSTVSDDRGRKTVLNLVPANIHLFPVGRLDYGTTGALLLTNDGELAYRLTHPRYQIEKEYIATLDRPVLPKDLQQLRQGIALEDGMTSPCVVRSLREGVVLLILREGRKRQVKQMFVSLNYRVKYLQRKKFAGLSVDDLKIGEWRELTLTELKQLYQMTKLRRPA